MRTLLLSMNLAPALLAVALYLPVSPAQAFDLNRLWAAQGEGPAVRQQRDVGDFSALRLKTQARVVVRQGDRVSVQVAGEGNVVDLIDTTVDGDVLVVEDRRGFKSAAAEVVITVRQIDSISTGASVAVVAERLSTPALSMRMGGASVVDLKGLDAGRLSVALGGSSVLKVGGVAQQVTAALGGSAVLQAASLEAGSVSVVAGGSSQGTVWAKDSLKLVLGGSSRAGYYSAVAPSLTTGGSATLRHLGSSPDLR